MLVKLEWLGYRMVKKLWRYVKPFSSDTGTLRTKRQTDGQTDRFAISISRVSVLTRDKNVGCGTWKRRFFCTCGSNNWETVEDRWVHAARRLASTELSFHSCNVLRDRHSGVPRANKKWRPGYVKMTIFCYCGSNNWETVIDRQLTLNAPYLPNAKAYELQSW